MKKKTFNSIKELIDLMSAAHDEIKKASASGDSALSLELLGQCQDAAIRIGTSIEESEGEGTRAVKTLEQYCELVYEATIRVREKGSCNIMPITSSFSSAKKYIEKEIQVKKEVVFLPYKASMWDSFETVWKRAEADPGIDAYVIPIPYFDKNPDGSVGEMRCEAELFPEEVPVVDYNSYDFEGSHPDEIYIHNPYDEYNTVTTVHPFFYSVNLKKYTDKLIYIPYFVLGEPDPDNPASVEGMSHFVTVPGVIHADEVIVQSENMKRAYVNALCAFAGEETRPIWESKIKGTGSPKLERIRNLRREDITVPAEWERLIIRPDGSRKKVIIYNTTIGALLSQSDRIIPKIRRVFDIFKENRDDVVLLWRPHPLLETTIRAQRPELLDDYLSLVSDFKKEGFGIFDDTPDMDRALVLADAYYGDHSSLVQLARERGIPIMIQNVDV